MKESIPLLVISFFLLALQSCYSIKLEIENNTVYNVTIGEDATLTLKYVNMFNITDERINFQIQKTMRENQTIQHQIIYNYYFDPVDNTSGEIVWHFRKVKAEDAGSYIIRGQTNFTSNLSTIFVVLETIARNASLPPVADDDASLCMNKLIVFIVPTACAALCTVVILVSICVVKTKSSRNVANSTGKKLSKTNYYVKTEGKTVPSKKPEEHNDLQNRPARSRMEEASKIDAPPPFVTQRTTSLHPNKPRPFNINQPPQNKNLPSQRAFNEIPANLRKSLNSLDSFEDCDDPPEEYENTVRQMHHHPLHGNQPFSPPKVTPKPQFSSTRFSHSTSSGAMMGNVRTSNPTNRLAPTPKPFYQNQFQFQQHQGSCEDDGDIYEGMG